MQLGSLCSFLESLFVELEPGVGCLRESPRVEANVCYTNTNYLALRALRVCGSRLAEPIERFLERYDHAGGGRFEVLWLEPIPYPPQAVKTLVLDKLEVDGNVIEVRADVPCGESLPDWGEYADLLMLAALEKLRRGDRGAALALRNRVLDMWDGIGFADRAYKETRLYETYKLSLYHFLARALRVEDEVSRTIPSIVEKMVTGEGGVVTHYTESLEPKGDPNVETTSVTILAFYSDYPERFPAGVRGEKRDGFALIPPLVAPRCSRYPRSASLEVGASGRKACTWEGVVTALLTLLLEALCR